MKRYLHNYIKEIDSLLDSEIENIENVLKEHQIKISFFQHERLIHLLVTVTYAILMVISFVAAIVEPLFVFIGMILMIFLIPYVIHYFSLENGVQYLYKQYDKLKANKEV